MRSAFEGPGFFRRSPLAAHFFAMFALSDAGASFAGTAWTVDSCSNFPNGFGNSGTLRYALNHAIDGDTVDMTTLVCSTIDLTESGTTEAPLPIPYGTVTVLGPGKDKLTITGNNAVRIFSHVGVLYPSNLVLEDLTLAMGSATYEPIASGNGGCIYTTNSVTLDRVNVGPCRAPGRGGGIRAADVTLDHALILGGTAGKDGGGISATVADVTSSVVTGNQAASNGGGIRGTFTTVTDSTVRYNVAGTKSSIASGGGIFANDNLTVTGSTVNGNYAYGAGGGIQVYNGSPSGFTTTIVNSTISGNVARSAAGGIYSNSGHVKFYNSTIAFNDSVNSSTFAAGVATGAAYGDLDLTFYSTLISNNKLLIPDTENDFSVFPGVGAYTITLHGSHNFARVSSYASSVFSFEGACPLLGPLKDNGGPTWTHALSSKSPAIDAGNNVYSPTLLYDQRGTPFSRVVKSAADIGAYEVPAEIVFNSGFEGC